MVMSGNCFWNKMKRAWCVKWGGQNGVLNTIDNLGDLIADDLSRHVTTKPNTTAKYKVCRKMN